VNYMHDCQDLRTAKSQSDAPSIGHPRLVLTLPAVGGRQGLRSTEPERAGGASWKQWDASALSDDRSSDTRCDYRANHRYTYILMGDNCVAQLTAVANCGKYRHSPFDARNARVRWDPA
jgi:hypothetical protein